MTAQPGSALPRRSTILLLEQNYRSRAEHALILHSQGYDVECTGNEAEAHLLCDSAEPDLMLVGFDGSNEASWAMCEKIRRRHPQQRIALLHGESLHLCPLFFNDMLISEGEVPQDLIGRVEALLRQK